MSAPRANVLLLFFTTKKIHLILTQWQRAQQFSSISFHFYSIESIRRLIRNNFTKLWIPNRKYTLYRRLLLIWNCIVSVISMSQWCFVSDFFQCVHSLPYMSGVCVCVSLFLLSGLFTSHFVSVNFSDGLLSSHKEKRIGCKLWLPLDSIVSFSFANLSTELFAPTQNWVSHVVGYLWHYTFR